MVEEEQKNDASDEKVQMKGYETLHYPFIYYHLPLKNHESEVTSYKNIYPFFNMKNEISIAKTFKLWL